MSVLELVLLAHMVCSCRVRREHPLQVMKELAFVRARNWWITEMQNVRQAASQWAGFPQMWYLAEPLYSCEHVDRLGDVIGDGAKYICNIHFLRQRGSCLYYGVGVDGDTYFDESLRTRVECEMYTFDPFVNTTDASVQKLLGIGVNHHGWALSALDKKNRFTLGTMREKLGHANRTIDILKVDIEGSEWTVFDQVLGECVVNEPVANQMQIEFHSPKVTQLVDMLMQFDRCGYRLFYKDMNLRCSRCVELGFVHKRFLTCVD